MRTKRNSQRKYSNGCQVSTTRTISNALFVCRDERKLLKEKKLIDMLPCMKIEPGEIVEFFHGRASNVLSVHFSFEQNELRSDINNDVIGINKAETIVQLKS